MRRLLGVDLGSKRIGLALAEADALRARPLTTISRGSRDAADADALARIVAANGVVELVVGLPLDMAGTEGPAATGARAWAGEMAARLAIPVCLRDERLSSHVAEARLGPARRGRSGGPPGPTRRAAHRARIDREAALVILEDELAARALGKPGERVDGGTAAAGTADGADEDRSKSGTIARPVRIGGDEGTQQEPG